jgi:CorA-like Mg2+ transporter protein
MAEPGRKILATASGSVSVTVSQWSPGCAACVIEPEGADPGAGVRWIDIDVSDAEPRDRDQREAAAAELCALIGGLCGGQLEQPMVADLLGCRTRPEQHSYAGGRVRLFVAFEAETAEIGAADDGTGTTPAARMLICQPVGFLAGDGWIVTCWHHRQGYQGAVKIPAIGAPKPHDDIFDAVAQRWQHGLAKTAGDLGVLIFNELALSYAPAHRRVYAWLETWELTLYLDGDIDGRRQVVDRTTLPDLWGTMAVLRDWLSPLDRAGLHADIGKAWFWGCTDHEAIKNVDDRIDNALQGLRDLGTTLRSSFGLLHIQIAEEQQRRGERLGRLVEYVTAAVLIPGLVVGFFGANTTLPGGGTWWGFWVMLSAMVILGFGSLTALRLLRRRQAAESASSIDDRARARAGLARELTDRD